MVRTTANAATAKKTTAKKTTATSTRRAAAGKAPSPAKKTTARKATTRKTAAAEPGKATKKATTSAARTKSTPAPVKKATAWPEFITHKMITAHYQARLHGLPTLAIRDWRELPDGTAALHFPSGARLDHTPAEDAPFHANTPCPHGSIHRHPVRTPADLTEAEQTAKDCTEHAGSAKSANIALTPVTPASKPEPAEAKKPTTPPLDAIGEAPTQSIRVPIPLLKQTHRTLGDQLTKSGNGVADTQPMSTAQIAAHIAETAKEHPQS